MKINKRILVAPLDWGLGHATRCIPVIRTLQQMGCEVIIATSGKQETLLKEEFPDSEFIYLPGYGVQYGKRGVMLRLIRQIPVIRRHIFTEHAWLQQAVREHKIDGVISDNRYGLYTRQVPSVLITHQLALQLPGWAKFFFRSGVQQMLYHHIEHFSECWIPDLPDTNQSLAGNMSHPATSPNLPIRYIGFLSRFQLPVHPPEREDLVLISISGPEPQREMLEELVLEQVKGISGQFCLVRGIPGNQSIPEAPENITIHNHLPTVKMQDLMLRCSLMVSRSGYSTLMDAMVLGTPLACIPTPGQTEQEYLSKRLATKGLAICQQQKFINLGAMLDANKKASKTAKPPILNTELEKVLTGWLGSLA